MMEIHAREYLLDIPFWTKKKNTLEQVRAFLEELGNPDEELQIIHVAGTNGKGSVCADLTSVLREAGYHVGTFVSPHLVDIRERFLLDGIPVSEEIFERSFQKVLSAVQIMTSRGYCHPTFFEFVFLMAMLIFQEQKPDYVILETGLGGRLDTTNVIRRPLGCVITSISLEHTQYLGDSIEKIASEKAGIIKKGIPVVYDANQPEASAVICKRAEEMASKAYGLDREDSYGQVDFAAPYQAMNAALAVKLLQVLEIPGVDDQVIQRGLSSVCWKGRMQKIGPGIWLDGAHNPGGIQAFIEAVRKISGTDTTGQGGLQLLFAAVSDKDYGQMIEMLCRGLPIDRVTVVHLNSDRGLEPAILKELFYKNGCSQVETYENVREALDAALRHKGEQDRLFAVGSLYLIGEIEAALSCRNS